MRLAEKIGVPNNCVHTLVCIKMIKPRERSHLKLGKVVLRSLGSFDWMFVCEKFCVFLFVADRFVSLKRS